MNEVHAIFYFKDNTILYIWSDEGVYNNKNLDMKFSDNVERNIWKVNFLQKKRLF